MAKSDNFRKQHADLVQVVTQISKILNPAALSKDAAPVANLLATLAGKLKVHLAMEDEALYPTLLAHKDAKIKATAQRFMTEMGGIKQVFTGYVTKWSSAKAIQGDSNQFVTDTQGLFQALAGRIEKENNELYPLLDAAN